MYIVLWDDWTGQRQQRTFDNLEDAQLEAAALREQFDCVQVKEVSER